jgi:hypothetical protein
MRRRRLVRASWKELLWCAVGFLIVQALLSVALETTLDRVRDPGFHAKLRRLRARRAEAPGVPLVLAMGSSRTEMGFYADLVATHGGRRAQLFNFAFAGHGPILHQVCLRRLRAQGIRPDLLLIELSPTSLLWNSMAPVEEKWLDGTRLRGQELRWLCPYYTRVPRLLWRWGISRLLPCHCYADDLRDALGVDGRRTERMSPHGWCPHLADLPPVRRQALTKMARDQYGPILRRFQPAPQSLRAMNDLLAACRTEHLPFALVLMPEADSFRALYPPAGETALRALCERLRETWQAPVVDARTWMAEPDFSDGHHLLPQGAKAFTARFNRDALPALLEQLPVSTELAAVGRP